MRRPLATNVRFAEPLRPWTSGGGSAWLGDGIEIGALNPAARGAPAGPRHFAHVEPDELDRYVAAQLSDAYSIDFHCWQPDTFLDFFVAAREKFGLDFEVVAFAPLETEDDLEFIVMRAVKQLESSGRAAGDPPVAWARCPVSSARSAIAS